MNNIKENIIRRALLKNKKICLPESSDSRVQAAKKKLIKIGFNVIDFVYALGDHWNKVVIVGHNPAFIELINHFSDTGIDHLRTSGLAKISFDKDQWSEINKGQIILG